MKGRREGGRKEEGERGKEGKKWERRKREGEGNKSGKEGREGESCPFSTWKSAVPSARNIFSPLPSTFSSRINSHLL